MCLCSACFLLSGIFQKRIAGSLSVISKVYSNDPLQNLITRCNKLIKRLVCSCFKPDISLLFRTNIADFGATYDNVLDFFLPVVTLQQ